MKAKLLSTLAAAVITTFLSGCATNIQPSHVKDLGTEHILDKNYTLHNKQSAYVGEPLIKVKDYYVTKRSSQQVTASSDFVMTRNLGGRLIGSKGVKLPIVGTRMVNGVTYQVVMVNSNPPHSGFILVNPEGQAHDKVLGKVNGAFGQQYVEILGTYQMSPQSVKFTSQAKEEVSKSSGYLNYELIYNGRANGSYQITYREFSRDDLARPSFFQTLTYSTASDTIRFKKNKLVVHSTDNEKITYTVIEDAYR